MKKKICIIFSLFLSCLFSISPVAASSVDLNDMVVNAYINEDGSAHIQEIWDMNVNEGTEVYKVFDNMGASQISNLQVKDENGLVYRNIGEWDVNASRTEKNGKCGLVTKADGYELCFGVGEYGNRTYTFEYDVSYFVNQYTNDQGINYAFFSEMELEPRQAKITLSSPYEFNENNASIWAFGYNGKVSFEDGKVIMESDGSVPEGAKMQLLMRIDNGTFTKAYDKGEDFQDVLADAKQGSDYNDNDYSQNNGYYNSFTYDSYGNSNNGYLSIFIPGFVIFCIIGFIVIVSFLAKSSKKEKFTFSDQIPLDINNVNMFRDIPCQKDIFKFYYLAKKIGLISDSDKGGMISAVLLKWIRSGFIEFEKTEETHMIFLKKEGFSIDLDKEILLDHPVELKLLGFFRNAAGSNRKLETKEFDQWCQSHYEEIDHWFEEIETNIESEYREKGLLKLETTYTQFMGMKISHNTDVFDASVREEMEHIIGLKKFLQEMSLIDEKEVIEVKLWEEYLIFASILGIADKVQEQLGKMCPTFNEQSNLDTIYTMHMVHMFAYNSMRASASAHAQAEAARSGGFGGGSSFGGGGGGFSGGGGGGVR